MTIQLLTSAVVLIAAVSFRWEHFSHSLLMSTLRFMASSLSTSGQQHAGREITITGINSLLITLHRIGPYFTQCDLLANLIPGSLMLLNIMHLWWTGYPASGGIIFYWCFSAQLYHFRSMTWLKKLWKAALLNGSGKQNEIWDEWQEAKGVSDLILVISVLLWSCSTRTEVYSMLCWELLFLQWFSICWLPYVIFHNIIIACGCMGVCQCVCIWRLGGWVSIKYRKSTAVPQLLMLRLLFRARSFLIG